MGRMQGLSAVVTGGARGIGEGIVRRYVAEGARCVIADIDVEAGERLAAELGSTCASSASARWTS
jgi:NAD(P)-dependent dehydrogenase (short-subunit alcohol dehydrogenase family)